jgi:hypothetical protein
MGTQLRHLPLLISLVLPLGAGVLASASLAQDSNTAGPPATRASAPQADEADALHDAASVDVEARDDTAGQAVVADAAVHLRDARPDAHAATPSVARATARSTSPV